MLALSYLLICRLLGPILLGLAWGIAPIKSNKEKLDPYECGFRPIGGQTR